MSKLKLSDIKLNVTIYQLIKCMLYPGSGCVIIISFQRTYSAVNTVYHIRTISGSNYIIVHRRKIISEINQFKYVRFIW